MSIFRNDTLGSMTRGGQAIVHNLRMTMQVIRQTGIACLIVWIMLTGWALLEWVPTYTQYLLKRIGEAWFQVYVVGSPSSAIQFMTPGGFRYWTRADAILQSNAARKALAQGQEYLILYGSGSALIAFGIMLSVWCYFTRSGRHIGSNQYVRGASFAKARELRRRLRRLPKGCLTVGGIKIPADYEPEHLLLSGAPGTGKTNILHVMLEGIRKEGKRAIVYDTAGSFVERFYRPGKDTILNPFDSRSSQWSPWMDAPIDYHYDQIAESVVPDSGKDPFWAKSARGTLVAVMRALREQNRMLISVMLDVITRSGLKSLAEFVEGSDGAAFISQEGERTSAGIQAELASVLRGFRYLDDSRAGLSIRHWVTNEVDDGWLFITVKADQLPTLRPLITMWLDIAINAIMSMTPDQQRRLYCVIDELPSLQRLPSLSDFLARARKYGGCGILGFQSYPQLEATYGRQEAAALTGYCSTWVALRANDEPTARHISSNLGQVEQVEANEGMSYGVNDMRDGVSLSRTQVTRALVMPTEVMNLPNLTGYLRFGRDLPIIRFRDRYFKGETVATAFVERRTPAVRLDEKQKDQPESHLGDVGTSNAVEAGDPVGAMSDTSTPSDRTPDAGRDDRPCTPLPLIGISINSVSRPGGPSKPVNAA